MKTKLWGWPRFGEQFQKPVCHSSVYLKVLFYFLDSQLLLCKKNLCYLAAVVTSDTRTKVAKTWRGLQGESLLNAWSSYPVHLCEMFNVTPRNEDWTVSVKFHASPDRWKEQTHKFSGFQHHWWSPFVPLPLIPGPFPSPKLDGVMPGAQQHPWTYWEHAQQTVQL